MEQNCLVIIRSVNERTESLCKKLILQQGIPANQIIIVNEIPFSKALQKSFEEGMKANYKWTFCVDADVLLRPGSIEKMLGFAQSTDENTLEIQGFVLDKFFGGPRPAGNHLYRTSLLPMALKEIPNEGVDIRPESRTLTAMAKMGYPFKSVDYIVGIHDDYQYNYDIFRKCFVQAFKHSDRYALFMSIWKTQANFDQDFKVALQGFAEGVLHQGEVFINKDLQVFRDKFESAGLSEKAVLDVSGIRLETIEEKINSWKLDPAYLRYFPTLGSIAPPVPAKKKTRMERFAQKRKELSLPVYGIFIIGYWIKKVGEKLMLLGDKHKSI